VQVVCPQIVPHLLGHLLVFDGQPVMELITELLPEGEALHLARVVLDGQEWGRVMAGSSSMRCRAR
jgi:hypothetical protein